MDALMNFVQTILNMGAVAILPIMIFILGVIFRMKVGDALRSGLMVGIGFQGLSLVINLLMSTMQPALDYYQKMGTGYTTADLGWATVGAASWTVPFAAIFIPLAFLLNVIMIRMKWTKVMNVDIWNFIHMLIPGALAYALFGSTVLGIIVALIMAVVAIKFGERLAPEWQEFFGLDGTTCSTASYVLWYPIFQLMDKLYDHIPGLKSANVNIDNLTDKVGVFGEPCFMGIVIGLFLGLLTRQSVTVIIPMCIGFGAVLVLIPRMVAVMMEGITPLGNAANEFMKKWTGNDDELIIGMDVCLGLGDPTVIVCTAICIPVAITTAFVLPNMHFFPVGMLSGICYAMVMPALAHRGNFIRTLITGILFVYICAWAANFFTPEATMMMSVTGMKIKGQVTDTFFGLSLMNVLLEVIHRIII